MTDASLDQFQRMLDYNFEDLTLLKRAVTHSSLSAGGKVRDLERLEFLGDRVLGLMVAEELWRRFPKLDEGDLAPRLNAMVRKETCAKAAEALGVGPFIRMSAAEEQAGGREKKAILGDVCEALIGALYIDGGITAARIVFNRFWIPNFDQLATKWRDAKTTLQEWAQQKTGDAPHYDVVSHEGPAHKPAFIVKASIDGFKPIEGKGGSKRAAQMAAAQAFLLREKVWTKNDIN